MPKMTDPAVALASFQEEFSAGNIHPDHGNLDKDLYYHEDMPEGQFRATYVTLDGKTVTALVMFGMATTPMIDGHFCFAIGYAVPEISGTKAAPKRLSDRQFRN